VTRGASLGGVTVSRKGEARPPREPSIRLPRARDGRRVGAMLPTETYVRFKAYVARHGGTGEQVIVGAIEALLDGG
jgi:hypothetical protein